MTASVKILTTSTIDSSPAILIVSPNGHKTLINCGEGCQRSFLESTDRVRSVNQVCLTHIGYTATGGLPGMILTSADSAQASANAFEEKQSVGDRDRNRDGNNKGIVGTLKIIGPVGLKSYVHALRFFMRRDRFPLTFHEGDYHSESKAGDGLNSRNGKGKGKKRKLAGVDANDDCADASKDLGLFGITSIPMNKNVRTFYGVEETSICSYLFTTTPIAGKFQIQKARELGIPPGPLFSKLKAGKSVSFSHSTSGEQVCVEPEQVLEGGSDGVAVAVIYCPDVDVLSQFCNSHVCDKLDRYKNKNECADQGGQVKMELMVHYTPKEVFDSDLYQAWIREFGVLVKHMTLHPLPTNTFAGKNEEMDGSPFRSAVLGAMQRSLIQSNIYPNPIPMATEVANGVNDEGSVSDLSVFHARPGLEYIIVPLSKQGLDPNTVKGDGDRWHGVSKADRETIRVETEKCMAISEAGKILDNSKAKGCTTESESAGCLIFTGTGSAIPCKHRNVTGIFVGMNDDNGMLLDIGEGTVGQLIRSWRSTYSGDDKCAYIRRSILGIKAAWISHPHADHHLGIVRLLSQRNSILLENGATANNSDPLVLMSSSNVLRFLDEYSKVDPTIYGGYIPVDNRETLPELPQNMELTAMLTRKLGITRCVSVPVSHCYQSYGVVLDGTSFGRLVYSGDCRPSDNLVRVGQGADLLIHEATFENGMEEEAVLKMHSTVSEALSIAKRMDAKACILTHFSQRYPRIAPLHEEDSLLSFPVAFAFDFMKVTPASISVASKLTPALRMLYPQDAEGAEEEREHLSETKKKAQEILSTPGVFANVKCE